MKQFSPLLLWLVCWGGYVGWQIHFYGNRPFTGWNLLALIVSAGICIAWEGVLAEAKAGRLKETPGEPRLFTLSPSEDGCMASGSLGLIWWGFFYIILGWPAWIGLLTGLLAGGLTAAAGAFAFDIIFRAIAWLYREKNDKRPD